MDSSRENVIEYKEYLEDGVIKEKVVCNHHIKDFDPVKSLPRILYCKKCRKEVPREEIIRYNGKWYCQSCYNIVVK